MNETSRRRPDDGETGFGFREWLTVLLLMGGIAAGASGLFAAAYWLMIGR